MLYNLFILLSTSQLYKNDNLSSDYNNPLSIVSTVLYLLFVLAFVSALAYISLKVMYARSSNSTFFNSDNLINVIERLPLSQNKFLFLVKIGNNFYLLSSTDKEITLLSEVTNDTLQKDYIKKANKIKENMLKTQDGFNSFLNYFKSKFKR